MTAVLVPNGEQVFLDENGNPLAGGFVYMYVPFTTSPSNTWVDPAQTTLNTNPIVLDAAGRAIIFGAGQYRQVVLDSNGNLVWDQMTGLGDMAAQMANNVAITGGDLSNVNITNAVITASAISVFPSGTALVFCQASPPTGWVQDTSVTDAVLRLVSGSGGSTGGNWAISGMLGLITVDGTSLSVDELPGHIHHISQTVVYQGTDIGLGGGSAYTISATQIDTGSGTGLAGNPHTHTASSEVFGDGTWRPAYRNVIVGVKT